MIDRVTMIDDDDGVPSVKKQMDVAPVWRAFKSHEIQDGSLMATSKKIDRTMGSMIDVNGADIKDQPASQCSHDIVEHLKLSDQGLMILSSPRRSMTAVDDHGCGHKRRDQASNQISRRKE